MSFRCFFSVAFSLLSSIATAADWKKTVTTDLNKQCYFTAQEVLSDELQRHPENRQARKKIDRLDRFLSTQLSSPSLSFLDQAYLQGFLAWRRRDVREARNHWFAYLERKKWDGTFGDAQADEVRRYLFLCEEMAVPSPSVTPSPSPVLLEVPARRHSKRKTKSRASSERLVKTDANRVQHLLTKAERDHKNGQLEYALHLYELAEKMDPESKSIQEKRTELEQLIR